MRLRYLLSSLVFASAFALAAAPTPAEAMQNIKCIPADRALLKEWTELATVALSETSKAQEALAKGKAADLGAVRASYGRLLELDPKRFATPELRTQMEKVHQRLDALRNTLRDAKPDQVRATLEESGKLLAEHTAPAKG
jgi:hypothetical protein